MSQDMVMMMQDNESRHPTRGDGLPDASQVKNKQEKDGRQLEGILNAGRRPGRN